MTAPDDTTKQQDVEAIARLIAKFFEAVSFDPGGAADYQRIRDLFLEGGQLIRNVADEPEIFGVEEFIAAREAYARTGRMVRFREIELDDVTETFGRVGHRFSTYRKLGSDSGVDFDLNGRISTQVVHTPGGWRISVMAWDDERPGLTAPTR